MFTKSVKVLSRKKFPFAIKPLQNNTYDATGGIELDENLDYTFYS